MKIYPNCRSTNSVFVKHNYLNFDNMVFKTSLSFCVCNVALFDVPRLPDLLNVHEKVMSGDGPRDKVYMQHMNTWSEKRNG